MLIQDQFGIIQKPSDVPYSNQFLGWDFFLAGFLQQTSSRPFSLTLTSMHIAVLCIIQQLFLPNAYLFKYMFTFKYLPYYLMFLTKDKSLNQLLKLTVSWRIISEQKGLFFSRVNRGGVSGDGRGRPAFFIMLHNMRE